MKKLIEYIAEAEKGGYALGHFNFSDLATLKGIVSGFEKAQKEISGEIALIVGLSEGERDFIGSRQAVSLVKSYREAGLPVFLNADHTKSLEKAIEAAKDGFDAVLFDAGREPIEENIERTKEAAATIREIDQGIVIEGELGFLGEGSRIFSEVPEAADWSSEKMTTPEEAMRFVEETGVDLVAPAVGNIHGLIAKKGGVFENPELDLDRIGRIKEAVAAAMVLHGGSGIKDDELKAAVSRGMAVVHVSSELRLAWRKGLEESFAEDPGEIAPYKLLRPSTEAITDMVFQKLKLLNSVLY